MVHRQENIVSQTSPHGHDAIFSSFSYQSDARLSDVYGKTAVKVSPTCDGARCVCGQENRCHVLRALTRSITPIFTFSCMDSVTHSSPPLQKDYIPIFTFLQWGSCDYKARLKLPAPSLVILWIELGGKPKWLPLNFGYHDQCFSYRRFLCVLGRKFVNLDAS